MFFHRWRGNCRRRRRGWWSQLHTALHEDLQHTGSVQMAHASQDALPLAGGVFHFLSHPLLLALQVFVLCPEL